MEALYTAAQMRELDHWASSHMKISSLTLMENAARAVANITWEQVSARKRARVAVFCGPGNNAGDGFAAARLLRDKGAEVRTFQIGDWENMSPDAREMERRLVEMGATVEPYRPEERKDFIWLTTCDALVDAVFGVGLSRPVEGIYLEAVRCMNRLSGSVKVVAVDIPSGVESDTGRVLGEAVHAAVTVTFHEKKYGLMIGEGAVCAGEVRTADIGIPTGHRLKSTVFAFDQWGVRLPRRRRDAYKGDFGRLYILAGRVGYTGAPVLAATAALRSGAGLITVGTPAAAWPVVAGQCLEVMAQPLPDDGAGGLGAEAVSLLPQRISACSAVLVGPGLGQSKYVEQAVRTVLSHAECPVVLDADGLNALSAHIDSLRDRDGLTVLTPHDGEFIRLGGDLSGGDRLGAATDFAKTYGCVLVLKGHRTITAFPDGTAYINTTGNPGMATGGTGDVLAGVIASLLAQGMEPKWAVPAAVWFHGRTGDVCAEEKGEYGMTPGDMLEKLPYVIKG